eukprot:1376782-Pyramimonas_sp.AAC.1
MDDEMVSYLERCVDQHELEQVGGASGSVAAAVESWIDDGGDDVGARNFPDDALREAVDNMGYIEEICRIGEADPPDTPEAALELGLALLASGHQGANSSSSSFLLFLALLLS